MEKIWLCFQPRAKNCIKHTRRIGLRATPCNLSPIQTRHRETTRRNRHSLRPPDRNQKKINNRRREPRNDENNTSKTVSYQYQNRVRLHQKETGKTTQNRKQSKKTSQQHSAAAEGGGCGFAALRGGSTPSFRLKSGASSNRALNA